MSKLKVEKIGGFAGFGGTNAHLRSTGEIDMHTLSKKDQKVVEDLFNSGIDKEATVNSDSFRYRISRPTPKGTESVEADETQIPNALKQCVRDEFV
jgi:hypothetical protein